MNSISQAEIITISGNITLTVLGKIGIITFYNLSIQNAIWGWTTVATVGEQYLPVRESKSVLKAEDGTSSGTFYSAAASVNTLGEIRVNPGNRSKSNLEGQIVYIIA